MSNKVVQPPENIRKSPESRVSCRVPRKLMRRLKKIARASGIDVSDVVRISLNRQLPEYEQKEAA